MRWDLYLSATLSDNHIISPLNWISALQLPWTEPKPYNSRRWRVTQTHYKRTWYEKLCLVLAICLDLFCPFGCKSDISHAQCFVARRCGQSVAVVFCSSEDEWKRVKHISFRGRWKKTYKIGHDSFKAQAQSTCVVFSHMHIQSHSVFKHVKLYYEIMTLIIETYWNNVHNLICAHQYDPRACQRTSCPMKRRLTYPSLPNSWH